MMISVIVLVYKVEKYIEQCLESIIAQTYKDLEIILVDDGSPDRCPEICDAFAQRDDRIRVVHKKNEGICAARKTGLSYAGGDYICFVDGDDWIEPNMYQRIYEVIMETNADCIVTQFSSYFSDKTEKSDCCLSKPLYSRAELEREVFPQMLFSNRFYAFGIMPNCWTKAIKRELLEKHLYSIDDRIRLGEDAAFVYPCLMDSSSVAFIDETLYNYRINPESMTKAYDPNLKDIYMLPYLELVKKSEELGVDLSSQLPYYLLYLTNFNIRNEASTSNSKSKAEKREAIKKIVNNDELAAVVSRIDISLLPSHTKLLYACLKKKSAFMLQNYIKLLRNFL